MRSTAQRSSRHLPRYRRAEGYPEIRIGRPEHRLLEALGRFHYLTAPQLTRLLFSPKSSSYVQERLKGLFHAGYTERLYLPTATPHGSPLAIYALDKKGLAYLKANEAAPSGRFRPSEERQREAFFLRHTLSVNDFLILAALLTKQQPELLISQMLTERELRRKPVYVTVDKERIGVVPDCWLDLRRGRAQSCLAVELDRSGRVEREPWQRKIRGLSHWAQGPYQEAFGTESLTVCVIVLAGQRRLKELLHWTESELARLEAKDQADTFRLAAFDPAEAEVADVFFSPIWRRPFDLVPVPLLSRHQTEDETGGTGDD